MPANVTCAACKRPCPASEADMLLGEPICPACVADMDAAWEYDHATDDDDAEAYHAETWEADDAD